MKEEGAFAPFFMASPHERLFLCHALLTFIPGGHFLWKGTVTDWFETGKYLFNRPEKWGETIGDMLSASINPDEKAGWMDEQEKKIEQE